MADPARHLYHPNMATIRLAARAESPEVLATIDACRLKLNEDGIVQWDELYPSERTIGAAIDTESLYIATERDQILGGVGLDNKQPSEYGALGWSTELPTLVVHHLFVRPDHQRRGLATELMRFAESLAARDCASIRLDAYSENAAALALYESRGYDRVGEVFFPRRKQPFICFEKPL